MSKEKNSHKLLSKQLLQGDRHSLAKAITLIESSLEEHRKQAQLVAGKYYSSHWQIRSDRPFRVAGGRENQLLLKVLVFYSLDLNKKVAILAIDPSGPIAGGSILGDKTRMEELSRNENVFIRPSPSSGALGGVAHKTRENILLCEAAGFDVILVETVGVGQSEYQVHSMVDFFMVLIPPNAGDELQGIKRGIIELADVIVVNKADGKLVGIGQTHGLSQYESALQLIGSQRSFWEPCVLVCSSLKGEDALNLQKIWEICRKFCSIKHRSLASFLSIEIFKIQNGLKN